MVAINIFVFSASVAQKSKYTRQRIVEPTTDLHQIYEATQNMESTLDTLICKYCIIHNQLNSNME